MFSNKTWLTGGNRPNARKLYESILHPCLWEMGTAEAEALVLAQSRQQRQETYWLYQPSFRMLLW